MQEVFIIGSKGIPANYGGFESFVDQLVTRQTSEQIHYHVACIGKEDKEYDYHGARCFMVNIPNVGPAKAVLYDIKAFYRCLRYIREHGIEQPVIYILACRIGPFIRGLKRGLKKQEGKLYVNPDGHEWLRAKWSWPIKKYWKWSERWMVKYADLLICDSKNIESYIKKQYHKYSPKTTFIAYGSDTAQSSLLDDDTELLEWYQTRGLEPFEYYLIVGRFVPENNYETMICEFMKSHTKKKLAIVTNVEQNRFYDKLRQKTCFTKDERIVFCGTCYEKNLLRKIREQAYGYLHGHEVGGTNPSLLEALGSTRLNLLLDVGFNREVAEDTALYWTKEEGVLASLLDEAEDLANEEMEELGERARQRMKEQYSQEYIVRRYEELLLNER